MGNRLTLAIASVGGIVALTVVGYVAVIAIDGAPGRLFRNVSAAMEPTLLAGEQFSVRQFQGDPTGQITRGELIVHSWPPDPSKD